LWVPVEESWGRSETGEESEEGRKEGRKMKVRGRSDEK